MLFLKSSPTESVLAFSCSSLRNLTGTQDEEPPPALLNVGRRFDGTVSGLAFSNLQSLNWANAIVMLWCDYRKISGPNNGDGRRWNVVIVAKTQEMSVQTPVGWRFSLVLRPEHHDA